jgi:hypothetical protein
MTIFYSFKFENPSTWRARYAYLYPGTWCHSYCPVAGFHPLHSVQSPLLPLCFTTSLKSKSKLSYDRRSVGQSALVSGHHLGPVTIFFSFPSNCLEAVTGLLLWGALSVERTDLLLLGLASAVILESEFRRTHYPFFASYLRIHQFGLLLFSLYSLDTGHVKNPASSSPSIVLCVSVPDESFM